MKNKRMRVYEPTLTTTTTTRSMSAILCTYSRKSGDIFQTTKEHTALPSTCTHSHVFYIKCMCVK